MDLFNFCNQWKFLCQRVQVILFRKSFSCFMWLQYNVREKKSIIEVIMQTTTLSYSWLWVLGLNLSPRQGFNNNGIWLSLNHKVDYWLWYLTLSLTKKNGHLVLKSTPYLTNHFICSFYTSSNIFLAMNNSV